MIYKPVKTLGLIVGLVIVLAVVTVDVFLIHRMLGQGFGASSYLTGLLFVFTLPLLALLGYGYHDLLALRYHLDRNALVIAYGGCRRVVPMDSIVRAVPGSQVSVSGEFRGIGWPGYLRGHMRLKALGRLVVHSSEPLPRQLVIVTRSGCFGISPRDAQHFLEALEAHRTLGATRALEQTVERGPIAALEAWRDRWLWASVAIALVVNVALFGFIGRLYAYLPDRLPLGFDAQGQVGRILPKTNLLLVAGIGTLTLGVNSVLGFFLHRRERLGAYLLAGMSLVIQPILWWAVVAIVGGR